MDAWQENALQYLRLANLPQELIEDLVDSGYLDSLESAQEFMLMEEKFTILHEVWKVINRSKRRELGYKMRDVSTLARTLDVFLSNQSHRTQVLNSNIQASVATVQEHSSNNVRSPSQLEAQNSTHPTSIYVPIDSPSAISAASRTDQQLQCTQQCTKQHSHSCIQPIPTAVQRTTPNSTPNELPPSGMLSLNSLTNPTESVLSTSETITESSKRQKLGLNTWFITSESSNQQPNPDELPPVTLETSDKLSLDPVATAPESVLGTSDTSSKRQKLGVNNSLILTERLDPQSHLMVARESAKSKIVGAAEELKVTLVAPMSPATQHSLHDSVKGGMLPPHVSVGIDFRKSIISNKSSKFHSTTIQTTQLDDLAISTAVADPKDPSTDKPTLKSANSESGRKEGNREGPKEQTSEDVANFGRNRPKKTKTTKNSPHEQASEGCDGSTPSLGGRKLYRAPGGPNASAIIADLNRWVKGDLALFPLMRKHNIFKYSSLVKYTIDKGAKVAFEKLCDVESIDPVLGRHVKLDLEDTVQNNWTLMWYAAVKGGQFFTDILIARGVSVVNPNDLEYPTLLHRLADLEGRLMDTIILLIRKGRRAEVCEYINKLNDKGNSVLHMVLEHNCSAVMVAFLIRAGADISLLNNSGSTPADVHAKKRALEYIARRRVTDAGIIGSMLQGKDIELFESVKTSRMMLELEEALNDDESEIEEVADTEEDHEAELPS